MLTLSIQAGCQFTGYYSPELKSLGTIRWGNMNYERLDCFRTRKCSYLLSCLMLTFCPEMIRKQYCTVDESIRCQQAIPVLCAGNGVFQRKSTVKSRRPWLNLHQILSCGCNKTSQNILLWHEPDVNVFAERGNFSCSRNSECDQTKFRAKVRRRQRIYEL